MFSTKLLLSLDEAKKALQNSFFSKIDAVIDQIGNRGTMQEIFSGTLEFAVY